MVQASKSLSAHRRNINIHAGCLWIVSKMTDSLFRWAFMLLFEVKVCNFFTVACGLLCIILSQSSESVSLGDSWLSSWRLDTIRGRGWHLIEGFLSAETLEADVWIKNLWYFCQECVQFQSNLPTTPREGGGCANVCMCIRMCVHTCVCDYRKFTECKTEIYKAKPQSL